MNYSSIKVNITKPQNMSELIEKYSIEVAKITSRQLPKDTLNNLIKKLETITDVNIHFNESNY